MSIKEVLNVTLGITLHLTRLVALGIVIETAACNYWIAVVAGIFWAIMALDLLMAALYIIKIALSSKFGHKKKPKIEFQEGSVCESCGIILTEDTVEIVGSHIVCKDVLGCTERISEKIAGIESKEKDD